MFYTWLDAELLGLSNKKNRAWKCTVGFLGDFWHLDKRVRGMPNPKVPRVNKKKTFLFFFE